MAPNSVATRPKGDMNSTAAASSKSFSYLGHLAAEIHICIAQNLGKEDLRSLRRVSRALAEDTFDVFAEKNFKHVSYYFTTQSLGRLRDISATPQFARYVESIALCAESTRKTELSWPDFIPEIVTNEKASQLLDVGPGRAREAADILLRDIFSKFARCGSARCLRLSTTEEFFVPALHAVSIALNASGHIIEELHCYTYDRFTPALEALVRAHYRDLNYIAASEFPDVVADAWSKLRTLQVYHQARGEFWHQVGAALHSLIYAASNIEELTLQVPLGRFHEDIGQAITPMHSVRMLKLLGPEQDVQFGDVQMTAMLSNVQHTLEILMLEDIKITDGHWKNILEWVSNAMNLSNLSCQNLQAVPPPFAVSWVLLDGHGKSRFEMIGSAEEVKERLAEVIAQGRYRFELEIDLPEWPDEEEGL
ncbi:hypothetical protein CERZMDRAFT_87900 [Cercospora zeae-maydis SCOH1-5]|uniref:F-box domain-containing protein n=1 Tax=Cercospora zeae-maydis SCOH1-5 TaxID=717836 RepID=A0A6A6F112_9PEZI|nr:hypothetical protein CERZMDRAFT_87900 [Cercospora zeae-maydis SCOH1-5]